MVLTDGIKVVQMTKVENYFINLGISGQTIPGFNQLVQALSEENSVNKFWGTVSDFVRNFVETHRPDLLEKAFSLLHNVTANGPEYPIHIPLTFDHYYHSIFPDPYWSLVSTNSDFKPLTIRRYDGAQLYFCKFQSLNNGKYAIYILQAVARNDTDYSATYVPVLRGKISIALHRTIKCAIVNEKAKKLYLVFGELRDHNQSELIKVNGYNLSFDPADPLGHIRIHAINGKWWTFVLNGYSVGTVCSTDPKSLIFVSHYFASRPRISQVISLVRLSKNDAKIKGVYGPMSLNAFVVPNVAQTDGNKRLILLYKPGIHLTDDLLSNELIQGTKTAFLDVFDVDTVNKPHFKRISYTEIDHVSFLKHLMPANQEKLPANAAHMSATELSNLVTRIDRLKFVGIALKHFIFSYSNFLIAVKHFTRLCDMQKPCNKIVIAPTFFWLNTMKLETFLIAKNYVINRMADAKQVTHMLRYNLTPFLNDYRKCANCEKVEEKKRRNCAGKRIALFKVCRVCKTKNFHLNWKEIRCHYCSVECMKAHWKIHKDSHRVTALDRNFKSIY